MPTRQKIVRLLSNNNMRGAVNFHRTEGYAIGADGKASYSISSNCTHARTPEQKAVIQAVSELLDRYEIPHRIEVGDTGHLEVVVLITNPARGY